MRLKLEYLLAACPGIALLACNDLPVATAKSIAANYSVYSVNGNSPDVRVQFNIAGDKIVVPRGSLIFKKDGTANEIVQYVIYNGSGVNIAASTDTVVGH